MNAPLTRRSLLGASTAAIGAVSVLPAAGLSVASLAVAPHPDPFATFHGDILAAHAAIEAGCPDDEAERLMDRWGEIDALALAGQPTTLAGAFGALQMARREFVQFQMMDREDQDDPSKRLVLHLLDGAISVLRQAAGGGVA